MSRIRSLFPEQWTDEDFVSCSMAARLLALALRNEADDNGVFEWKPMGLRIRLFPIDAVDIAALLAELVEHRQIVQFQADGRTFGAIRNFRLWQNPRNPMPRFPLPDDMAVYVGKRYVAPEGAPRPRGRPRKTPTDANPKPISDELPPQAEKKLADGIKLPPEAEKKFQREEGGGKREDGNKKEARMARFAASGVVVPDDIPLEAWVEFEMMRKRRNPMTDRARELVWIELRKLAGEGDDMTEVLEQSIRCGWTDVYNLRSNVGAKRIIGSSPPFHGRAGGDGTLEAAARAVAAGQRGSAAV